MKYRFLEEIALADTAFEAFGKTEKELFENSALALAEVMAETKKVKPKKSKKIELKAETLEQLLHDWLEELVFLKDEQEIVFCKFQAKIQKKAEKYFLGATVFGQKISELNEKILKTDVKAVTWHQFGIQKTKKGFTARVVLDV